MEGRILVVEDDVHLRTVLRAYLVNEGFAVTEVATGADALAQVTSGDEPIDLVVLDLGLPDMDGLEVLSRVRVTSDVPVIIVTARAEEVDKLVGLRVGADDYVTKPFSPREVAARVQTVLRRTRRSAAAAPQDPVLRYPGISIDPRSRQVDIDGQPVALSALEFDILVALATDPGRVFSRIQLLEQVWGYDFYGDERVVDVHIRGIRVALGDHATRPRFVGTTRGVGYQFVAGRS